MKMSKLSNQTNSQDPQAVNSRVFVGNLNTFQCSKTDVERMFQRYGRLVGISMHKGYAFVQFTNPFDARNACHGEDGRTILSQVLDVNMVAEPKPHQTGRKRQNITKTGNDWDYYYDSYYASTLFAPSQPRPVKRQRLMTPQNRPNSNKINLVNGLQQQQVQQLQQQQQQQQQQQLQQQHQQQQQHNSQQPQQLQQQLVHQQQQQQVLSTSPTPTLNGINSLNGHLNGNSCISLNGDHHILGTGHSHYTNGQNTSVGPFKIYSNPDTLICGNCRELFTDLAELLDHKRTYCKLRFTCKCQEQYSVTNKNQYPSAKLICVVCKDSFTSPWDLMVHAQAAHMINIYEIGDSDDEKTDSENQEDNSLIELNVNGIEKNDELNGNSINQDEEQELTLIHMKTNRASSEDNISFEDNGFISPILQSDDIKMNGGSSNGFLSGSSSPIENSNSPPRACIVRALSIDTSESVDAPTALGLVTTSLALSITNGAMATQ